jgi:hypothetical protein
MVQHAVSGRHCSPHGLKPRLHAMPHVWLEHTATPFDGVGQSTSVQHCPAFKHVPLHAT